MLRSILPSNRCGISNLFSKKFISTSPIVLDRKYDPQIYELYKKKVKDDMEKDLQKIEDDLKLKKYKEDNPSIPVIRGLGIFTNGASFLLMNVMTMSFMYPPAILILGIPYVIPYHLLLESDNKLNVSLGAFLCPIAIPFVFFAGAYGIDQLR